jgi:hypothetical protein
MVNKRFGLVILVILLIFGMTVVGCNAGSSAKLSGKYVQEQDSQCYVVFKGKNEVIVSYSTLLLVTGTYELKGSEFTIKTFVLGKEKVWKATLSDDKKSFVSSIDAAKYIKEK